MHSTKLPLITWFLAMYHLTQTKQGISSIELGARTKIGLNNTDTNDQGAFDATNNHFVAPMDST